MPRDTVWYNNTGNYFIVDVNYVTNGKNIFYYYPDTILNSSINTLNYCYNPKNSPLADSILKEYLSQNPPHKTGFEKQKDYYDNLATTIELIILLCAIAFGYYAYKRAQKYINNPEGETEKYVEIGTRRGLNRFGEMEPDYAPNNEVAVQTKPYLTYFGNKLNFTQEQIIAVLDKRFPYFKNLGIGERTRFYNRLRLFMKSKIFSIHDSSGFKEMPILLSATAIQFSFGLDEYMLPHYKNIHIFPQEFLGTYPTIRFLEGNVSGNSINISWKHFLNGYADGSDGQNVGLHEFAHAYHAQNFSFDGERDTYFIHQYGQYDMNSNKVFEKDKIKTDALYTNNAFRNKEEFYAETVELFFERPKELKEKYSEIYESISLLLNQKLA
jgi:MtfA peptidase